MGTQDLNGKLARWPLKLQDFDLDIMDIIYRPWPSWPGPKHGNVDALSRLLRAPAPDDNDDDKEDEQQIKYSNGLSRALLSEPLPRAGGQQEVANLHNSLCCT